MKPMGVRKTREHLGGHQDCAICRPWDVSKGRARRQDRAKCAVDVEPCDVCGALTALACGACDAFVCLRSVCRWAHADMVAA